MLLTDIIDPKTKKVVQTIDLDENCNPYSGSDYYGHCGGCGNCLAMQASHWGYEFRDHKEDLPEKEDYLERLGVDI